MALHTDLPIYKVAYDLFDVCTDLAKNMARDFKTGIGGKLRDECIEIVTLIFRANVAQAEIEAFLASRLNLRLNQGKTILQPVDRGVDFVGQVIKPWCRTTRRRTVATALQRTAAMPAEDLFETANSYFGLLRQAGSSHTDRARMGNLLRHRGHCINGGITKTFRVSGAR